MSNPVFIQNSRIGSAIFQVVDGQVVVTNRDDDRNSETRVEIRTLDSRYRVQSRTLSSIVLRAVSVAFIAAGIGLFIARIDWIPWGARVYLAYLPFLFAAIYLIVAVRFTPRFDFVIFDDHWGRPALCIVRERAQSAECMAFADALVAHIELANSDLPAEERDAALRVMELDRPPTAVVFPASRLWKFSILSGALAVLLPLVPVADHTAIFFLFMLDVLLITAAAALALVSIMNREPGRWWACIAFVLAAIPVIFY